MRHTPLRFFILAGLLMGLAAFHGCGPAFGQAPEAGVHAPAAGEAAPPDHSLLVKDLLAALVLLLVGAKLGGAAFERLVQPAVLGEILAGILLGNLGLLGFQGLDFMRHSAVLTALSELGVILLLFEVGLESN